MKKLNIEELYECFVTGNYAGYEEYEKYHYYLDLFYPNFHTSINSLSVLIDLLNKYYNEIEKLSIDFIKEIQDVDRMQLVGISTGNAINAVGLLLNRQEYPFSGRYYKYFKLLFEAAKKFNCKELNEVNKYRNVYDEVRWYTATKYKNLVDEDKYHNFQYNYHMLVVFATSYAYYMNYEPEKISDIVDFFVRNYEQIINIFDVNGLTKDDFSLSMDGLSYYMHYYEKNNEKEELKRIM